MKNIIQLRKGKAGKINPAHPWIYKSKILGTLGKIEPGGWVSVIGPEGEAVGTGYYNPRSEISVRLFSFGDEALSRNMIAERIGEAASKREKILEKTNACRMVFSEADRLPGLIVDLYSDVVVFQALTLGIDKRKEEIVDGIKKVIRPRFIYEKSVSPYRRLEGLDDVKGWWGAKGDETVEIFEGGVKFLVDIARGHKTGFYLDQRRSRMGLGGISKGKRVLDLFCYAGGFAVSALVFGAAKAVGADIKGEWLDLARKNAGINGVLDRAEFIKGDAFAILKNVYNSGGKFDIIVVDPPSFLRSKKDIKSASRAYLELNTAAMETLEPGGVLATFSCSHYMTGEIFSGVLKRAAQDAGRKTLILKRCHQAEDHPIVKGLPETEYLKGYFLKVE